jgi:uncharacterized membrane protein YeaQ/YmgE (transglycosylase-associated protein family)
MEEYLGFLFFVIILGIVTGIIGEWIARQKGRSEGEGFWLGFLLSFIGLIIEVVLPKISKPGRVEQSSGINGRVNNASASDGRSRRKCPFCAEMILTEASICRYCQRDVPLGEVGQGPSSNVLSPNEFDTAYTRQDCPEISIKSMRPIEPSEIPQGADPCAICNTPAVRVHEAGAQASTNAQRSPTEEHSSLVTSSSTDLNSRQTEQAAQESAQTEQAAQESAQTEQVEQAPAQTEQVEQAPAQTEQVAQAPTQLTCPSCSRRISANDAFCFFCGKKLRT